MCRRRLIELIDANGFAWRLGCFRLDGRIGAMVETVQQQLRAAIRRRHGAKNRRQADRSRNPLKSTERNSPSPCARTRIYLPFSLTLLKATHTVYAGTDIPKDFRSRVQLQNPQTGENREVEISMNHPLRYAGLTFYQYQMDGGRSGAARRARRPRRCCKSCTIRAG